jgi:hypothetical protein
MSGKVAFRRTGTYPPGRKQRPVQVPAARLITDEAQQMVESVGMPPATQSALVRQTRVVEVSKVSVGAHASGVAVQ